MTDYIPDHRERARADLLSQFRHKTRIEALIRALALGTQNLEDALLDFVVSLSVDFATDELLNRLGKLVGEQRLGLSDSEFRRIIRVRIAANRSSGTRDELISIFEQATDAAEVRYVDSFPAAFLLIAFVPEIPSQILRDRINAIIEIAKPAGVNFTASYNITGGSTAIFNQSGRGFGARFGGII